MASLVDIGPVIDARLIKFLRLRYEHGMWLALHWHPVRGWHKVTQLNMAHCVVSRVEVECIAVVDTEQAAYVASKWQGNDYSTARHIRKRIVEAMPDVFTEVVAHRAQGAPPVRRYVPHAYQETRYTAARPDQRRDDGRGTDPRQRSDVVDRPSQVRNDDADTPPY